MVTSFFVFLVTTDLHGTSIFFPLERGVRQGDPPSLYLFIVVVDTLAIAIFQNQGIRRIVFYIENVETKILQYNYSVIKYKLS